MTNGTWVVVAFMWLTNVVLVGFDAAGIYSSTSAAATGFGAACLAVNATAILLLTQLMLEDS